MGIRDMSDVEGILGASPSIRDLHSVWAQRRPIAAADLEKRRYGSSDSAGIPWLEDTSLARKFVAHALHAEEFLLAIDAAREILRGWENAGEDDLTQLLHIRRDYASARTRLGFTREARHELELASSRGTPPSEIGFIGDQMEEMAMREHDRWMEERRRQGWTYAPLWDNARKHHPSLVPWERLPETEKDKDRDAIRNFPALIAKACLSIRPIG